MQGSYLGFLRYATITRIVTWVLWQYMVWISFYTFIVQFLLKSIQESTMSRGSFNNRFLNSLFFQHAKKLWIMKNFKLRFRPIISSASVPFLYSTLTCILSLPSSDSPVTSFPNYFQRIALVAESSFGHKWNNFSNPQFSHVPSRHSTSCYGIESDFEHKTKLQSSVNPEQILVDAMHVFNGVHSCPHTPQHAHVQLK